MRIVMNTNTNLYRYIKFSCSSGFAEAPVPNIFLDIYYLHLYMVEKYPRSKLNKIWPGVPMYAILKCLKRHNIKWWKMVLYFALN